MIKYSVTGTTECRTDEHWDIIDNAIKCLTHVHTFNTGGALGVDSVAARLAAKRHPQAFHVLYYPETLFWNKPLLQESFWWHTWAVAGSYMDRNDVLVLNCNILLAFPQTAAEVQRSGTWATVRRARKAKKPIWVYPLDGSYGWKEGVDPFSTPQESSSHED